MRMIDADVLISLLQENVEAKKDEIRKLPGGAMSSNPKILVKEGHINGLEAAIVVAERFATLLENMRKEIDGETPGEV